MSEHRRLYRHSCRSHELLTQPDVRVELIESYPCASREELCRREGHWIRNTPDCVNRCIAGRSKKEWAEDNHEHRRQANADYRDQHRDVLREYYRQWDTRQECPCGGSYTKSNKARHIKSERHLLFLAENNAIQTGGDHEVVAPRQKVQGDVPE